MVRQINVSVDDEVHERAKETKNRLGLTWQEFIDSAAEELHPGGGSA